MRRTIADELEEQGAVKRLKKTLIRQMTRRFGDVPAAVSATIGATDDLEQLDEWLERFATAETLDDVGIGSPA